MAKDVVMPVLGMTQDSGVLVRWLARSGDEVAAGTPLMEVETDKAVVEVDAPASGVLADVALAEGESAPVGTVIARIYAPSEAPAPGGAAASGKVDAEPPKAPARSSDGGHPVAIAPASSATTSSGTAFGATGAVDARGFVRSSPLARRLAEELGVEMASLAGRGAGPGGAVVASDVTSAASARAARPATRERHPSATGLDADASRGAPTDRDVVTLSADVDLDAIRRLAERLGGADASPSAGDLLVLLVLFAIRGALGADVRVALRRVGHGVDRRTLWSGERPVLDWLTGLDRSDEAHEGDSDTADAVVTDATTSRVRHRGGLGARRLAVALGGASNGNVTVEVTAGERDAALAERLIDDLVLVAEDPAWAPFVLP